jgi:hypothetical protein
MEREMKRDQIKILAIEELDIEELERRIELAPLAAAQQWLDCHTHCSNYGG